MRYVILILSGISDGAYPELDDRSPLEAAVTPHLDRLSMMGRRGTALTLPAGYPADSAIGLLAVLGYDPRLVFRGRGPIEALGAGVDLGPQDWAFRASFITIDPEDHTLADHTAGHFGPDEAEALLTPLAAAVGQRLGEEARGLEFVPIAGHRNLLIDRAGRDWAGLEVDSPQELLGRRMTPRAQPRGVKHARLLKEIIAISREVFTEHDVNRTRRETGEPEVTSLWLWGPGQPFSIPRFETQYGLGRGVLITDVDLARGVGRLMGWEVIAPAPIAGSLPPAAPGSLDPGMLSAVCQAIGARAAEAIASGPGMVAVYVKSPDDAAHRGDLQAKIAALEAIDAHVVGPVLAALESDAGVPWRALVTADHGTVTATRRHDSGPVPFAMAGERVPNVVQAPFTEAHATAADLHVEVGHDLMEFFLFSGLTARDPRRSRPGPSAE